MTMEDSAVKLVESPNVPEKQDFESSDLYLNIYSYVEEYMGRYDMSHDFNHICRVLALSKHILAQELRDNPQKTLDTQAVVLGALLHDVGDKKYVKPSGRVAVPDAFSPILQQVCVPLECVAKESRRYTYATWV